MNEAETKLRVVIKRLEDSFSIKIIITPLLILKWYDFTVSLPFGQKLSFYISLNDVLTESIDDLLEIICIKISKHWDNLLLR